ncbi:MAG: hypothetical protein IJY70_05450 [Clostridia bacterium]|nr:hypothetical protein [Clostridia bacterium]
MTMGLILLGIMAITLFFNFGRRAFSALNTTTTIAFAVLVAFAIGIIVPAITPNDTFYLSVGGFIMPIILSLVLFVSVVKRQNAGVALVSMLAAVAVTTLILLFMPTTNTLLQVLCSLEIGIIAGAVSYFIAKRPLESVFALTSGVCVGNLIYSFIDYFARGAQVFSLGNPIVYNALFVSVLFVLCVDQVMAIMGKTHDEGNYSRRTRSSFEASKDEKHKSDDDYFSDLF